MGCWEGTGSLTDDRVQGRWAQWAWGWEKPGLESLQAVADLGRAYPVLPISPHWFTGCLAPEEVSVPVHALPVI